jgi:hypothetical protein
MTTKEEIKKAQQEEWVKRAEEARIALEQWSKEYSVGLDMEMLYTPEQGFKKTIVILNIEN